MSRFEWLVAVRYLKAKRKQTVISVITVISILSVAAGVCALILAVAINNGFQNTLQNSLLTATAHVNIVERNPAYGIENWQKLIPQLQHIPHVVSASPGLYGQAAIKGPLIGTGAVLKGVLIDGRYPVPPILHRLKEGSIAAFRDSRPGIILGQQLARELSVHTGNTISVLSYQLSPVGTVPNLFKFPVAGIFESGMYELDSNWAFLPLSTAQRVLDLNDVVNTIELRLDDVFAASSVAKNAETTLPLGLMATTWMDQNRSLLNALNLEKTVSLITISLIELVAAFNILVILVTLVLEKQRDIAILLSMGCKRAQIQRIFILQGLIVGGIGCLLGLGLGYGLAALGQHFRPLQLDEQIYAISYVPFEVRWIDGLWVAALAISTSLLATIQPSRTASRVSPAEALRYE